MKRLTREMRQPKSGLGLNSVIFWAVIFTFSLWAVNLMSSNIIEGIEFVSYFTWPFEILEILHILGARGLLEGMINYQNFVRDKVGDYQCN